MIQAFIFDLDGTLVETEQLKARAYAAVAGQLLGLDGPDERALTVYERMVGSTDEMVARAMIDALSLLEALRQQMQPDTDPWVALHRLRMQNYVATVGAGDGLRAAAYPHNIDLLKRQKSEGRRVAVATSSFTDEAVRVVKELGVFSHLDAVVGRDQVTRGKPDPEIYVKTAERLGVTPEQALVVEDSPIGVTAAVAAGMACIAVANQFTCAPLREQNILPQDWVVYDPAQVDEVVGRRLAASSGAAR